MATSSGIETPVQERKKHKEEETSAEKNKTVHKEHPKESKSAPKASQRKKSMEQTEKEQQ